MRWILLSALVGLPSISLAEDLGDQATRCFISAGGMGSVSIAMEVKLDQAGSVVDIGFAGKPPVGPYADMQVEAATQAILRCAPYDVNSEGIFPVTFDFRKAGSQEGVIDPYVSIPRPSR